MTPVPPRLSRAVLHACARTELGRDAAADLDEEFRLQCMERGLRAASAWYRRQVLLSLLAFVLVLLRAERLRADMRHTLRTVHRDPQASAAVILAMVVALTTFAVLFALADPFTLRPLPYRDADRLVLIEFERGASPASRIPTLQEWQARTDLFDAVAAYRRAVPFRLHTDLGSPTFHVAPVSPNFLDVLGLPLRFAGTWSPSSALPPVVITSDGETLLTSFGITDSTHPTLPTLETIPIMRSGTLSVPLAFMAPATHALAAVDVHELLTVRWTTPDQSGWTTSGVANVIARLRRGVPPTAVESALEGPDGPAIHVVRFADFIQGDLGPIASGALATGLILWTICAGYVALFTAARTIDRRQEFNTRRALGAASWQLWRLPCLELGFLAIVSLAVSVLLSAAILHQLQAVLPSEYTTLGAPAITSRVLFATSFLTVLVVVVGVIPAFLTTPRTSQGWWRPTVATAQVALTLSLAIGAGLLVQSHRNLLAQDIGVARDAIGISTQGPAILIEETLQALALVPGATAVAAATSGYRMRHDATVPIPMLVRQVTRGYFAATGAHTTPPDLRLETGIVVSTSVARHMTNLESPIGHAYSQGGHPPKVGTVVGTTTDVFTNGLARPPSPAIFVPLSTAAPIPAVQFVIRGDVDSTAVRQVISRVNPGADIAAPQSLADALSVTVRHRTFTTWLLTGVCLSALLLSVASLWGMVAFLVSSRRHEFAVRFTLGATAAHVRWLVTRDALTTTLVGSVAGAGLGHWAAGYLEALLFQVEAGRWAWTLATSAVVALVFVGAARHRSRGVNAIDPVRALRSL